VWKAQDYTEIITAWRIGGDWQKLATEKGFSNLSINLIKRNAL
jgi:hypothetical protein